MLKLSLEPIHFFVVLPQNIRLELKPNRNNRNQNARFL